MTAPTITAPRCTCGENLRRFHRVWLNEAGEQFHWNGATQRMEPHTPAKAASKRRAT